MPVNRNALIRYRTLDKCLRNRFRQWTLEDLIDACSDALYEYEGIDKGVSRRTIQGDLQMMRSDKLGYNAPITVNEKKYYTYADADYSITNIPLSEQDLDTLNEVKAILQQFTGFTHFREVNNMIQKLEDKINTEKYHRPSVVDFERNDDLTGLEHLQSIYKAILSERVLELMYQPFRRRTPSAVLVHPYLLKEYNNRWFLLGKRHDNDNVVLFALDRIKELSETTLHDYKKPGLFDPQTYFEDVIGVTVDLNTPVEKVVLRAAPYQAPYILTKPWHPSQEVISQDRSGLTFSINVRVNYELQREIIAQADGIEVLEPAKLREATHKRLTAAAEVYS